MRDHDMLKPLEPFEIENGLKYAQSRISTVTTGYDSTWDEKNLARDVIPKLIDVNRASLDTMRARVDASFVMLVVVSA